MVFHVTYPRLLPERRPPNHHPAAPRYSLRWTDPVCLLISDYFAIQGEGLSWEEQKTFFDRLIAAFDQDGPAAHEIMRTTDETGATVAILVAYWLDATAHARWSMSSAFMMWFNDPARLREPRGIWRETICVPHDRFETVFSGPNYRIGFARTPGATIQSITTNGYFGAARDRFPISAIDPLESPYADGMPARRTAQSLGRRLKVASPHNMIAILSGQYWEGAGEEQTTDYHDKLQPKLLRGMDYLVDHPVETGTLPLRSWPTSIRREHRVGKPRCSATSFR